MSGETEANISGWTIDTLHSHVLRLIDEHDIRYEQRFQGQQREVQSALASAKEATAKAEGASEKRFDAVNEFRSALQDAATRNLSRVEFDAAHATLVDQVADLRSRFERFEATSRGTLGAAEQAKISTNRLIMTIIAATGVLVAGAIGVAAIAAR